MADKRSRSKGLNPSSMKGISTNKLKAFSVGQMNIGKKKSKKEEEEERKKHDEKATAKVFEEFVASFEDSGSSSTGKAFIRGSTINPETKVETDDSQTGKLYKPTSKISESIMLRKQEEAKKAEKAAEQARKKKEKERNKSKSNLENFLEELKVIQAEREIRHKLKKEIAEHSHKHAEPKPALLATPETIPVGMDESGYGSHDTGDPLTTNIFLGSLNPKMTEEMLCEEFGKYGPLASVKIMWPRTDEERSRNRNCGFVAYMNRKDAERGMKNLDGKIKMEYEMKLGWGKTVPIPPHPVFIPPQMLQLTLPPPPSGLPFNAQPKDRRNNSRQGDDFNKTLKDAVVKVVIPTERPMLHLIHRMIEFVVREGPMFEAMIMNRELNNPLFRFLFENTSPAHIYYRWKLYSILQGDSPTQWKTKEFRMFHAGSYWRPPPLNPYLHGMPESLTGERERAPRQPTPPPAREHHIQEEVRRRGTLSNHQRDKLEDMLRNLTMERQRISDTMVYCLDHGESAEEIVECISESLSILETPISKKIGRLFLVSDILYNSSAKVANASYYRKYFEVRLPAIFTDLYKTHQSIQQRLKAEHFKNRIMACFRAWEDWAVYPNDLLVRLQNVFLGLVGKKKDGPNGDVEGMVAEKPVASELDGLPLADESVDGQAISEDIDGKDLIEDVDGTDITEDLDGNPVENIDGAPMSETKDSDTKLNFAPSKWESVDASTLESQAMTTSKWELLETLEEEKPKEVYEDEEDEDGVPIEDDDDDDEQDASRSYDLLKQLEMTEERRAKLREIEVPTTTLLGGEKQLQIKCLSQGHKQVAQAQLPYHCATCFRADLLQMKVMKFQDDVEGGRRSRKSSLSISDQVQKYRKKLLQKERERAIEKQRGKDREKVKQKEQDRIRDYERAREKERIRLVDASDSESDTSKPKRRRSSSGSISPVSSKRYRSGSRSPASDRHSSRHVSREISPMSYDSPNVRKRSPPRKAHRSHRLLRADSRSPGRRLRRSRSRSPMRRAYSPYHNKSHRKKSKR